MRKEKRIRKKLEKFIREDLKTRHPQCAISLHEQVLLRLIIADNNRNCKL